MERETEVSELAVSKLTPPRCSSDVPNLSPTGFAFTLAQTSLCTIAGGRLRTVFYPPLLNIFDGGTCGGLLLFVFFSTNLFRLMAYGTFNIAFIYLLLLAYY